MRDINREALCFDMILVRKTGENYNELPIETFVALPVNERISLIMNRKVRFFCGEEEVATFSAIKSLDEARG